MTYTKEKAVKASIIALTFLIAKYQEVYEFQVLATVLKVLNDCFELDSMRADVKDVFTEILNVDIDVIRNNIITYGLIPIKKPRKKRIKSLARLDMPTKEQFRKLIDSGRYTKGEIIEAIAKEYKVSVRAVRRQMEDYGLTRKYTKQ